MQKENPSEGQQKNNLVFVTTGKLVDGWQVIVTVMLIVGMAASFLYGYSAYHYNQKLKEITKIHELYNNSIQSHNDSLKRLNEKTDQINKVLEELKTI